MSCENTNWPEYMMGNPGEKIPVSQRIHVQVGDTSRYAISYCRSNCYITVLAKLPDTTEPQYKKTRHGPLAAEKITLNMMEQECAHFRGCMDRLRDLIA